MTNTDIIHKPIAISSWSGGKDSCLACYKALRQGYQVKYLLHFISESTRRGCFHGIESKLMDLQAKLMGIPIIQKAVPPDMEKYEETFKSEVTKLQAKGAANIVCGDVYLIEQKSWVERVCNELAINCVEPLWEMEPANIVQEFIEAGFKAVVVSCKADLFGEDFIGRPVDQRLLADLKKKKICPCGENGEFHTFVTGGPIFSKSITITKSRPVLKEGFWKHWFLDIQEYKII